MASHDIESQSTAIASGILKAIVGLAGVTWLGYLFLLYFAPPGTVSPKTAEQEFAEKAEAGLQKLCLRQAERQREQGERVTPCGR